MSTSKRCSPEIRERGVRLVFEHEAEYGSQWAAIGSIAATMECMRSDGDSSIVSATFT